MDPLAQLKDIHLPQQVHNYPLAPGWWLLLAIVIALLVTLIIWQVRFHRRRGVKKQLLSQIQQSQSLEQSSTLLKMAILAYFPRQLTASLYGQPLFNFMQAQLPGKKQAQFKQLLPKDPGSIYCQQPEMSISEFNQLASFWLNHALPPKKRGAHD